MWQVWQCGVYRYITGPTTRNYTVPVAPGCQAPPLMPQPAATAASAHGGRRRPTDAPRSQRPCEGTAQSAAPPKRRISARPPREQIALGKPAAGTVPTAPDSTRRPDLDLPAFRRFSMITVRAGQSASHGSCTELSAVLLRPQRSPPPGRQHSLDSNFTRQRRRESPNQPARIPVCTRGSWPTTDGGELAMAASAVLDKVLLAPQLSKAVHALAAPPLAYASMSAVPSSSSHDGARVLAQGFREYGGRRMCRAPIAMG